jgi:hypothetical protein
VDGYLSLELGLEPSTRHAADDAAAWEDGSIFRLSHAEERRRQLVFRFTRA